MRKIRDSLTVTQQLPDSQGQRLELAARSIVASGDLNSPCSELVLMFDELTVSGGGCARPAPPERMARRHQYMPILASRSRV
jgi:hypothetical protein